MLHFHCLPCPCLLALPLQIQIHSESQHPVPEPVPQRCWQHLSSRLPGGLALALLAAPKHALLQGSKALGNVAHRILELQAHALGSGPVW